MTTQLELRGQILNELKKIIDQTLCNEDVKVYLFGSWVRNEEKQSKAVIRSCREITLFEFDDEETILIIKLDFTNGKKNIATKTTNPTVKV